MISLSGECMFKIITCKNPNQKVIDTHTKLINLYGLSAGQRQSNEDALVVTRKGLVLKVAGKQMSWHPGLLHALRESGTRHPWIQLGNIQHGDQVLDCTLGLGTDARFISEITKERVLGIEQSLAIFLITQEGLQNSGAQVDIQFGQCLEILSKQEKNSFDVVIADPMFPKHLEKQSHSLSIVRHFGSYQPLSLDWLKEAKRVARRCVLVKDHIHNDLLELLGAEYIWSKGKRLTRYGRWEASHLGD